MKKSLFLQKNFLRKFYFMLDISCPTCYNKTVKTPQYFHIAVKRNPNKKYLLFVKMSSHRQVAHFHLYEKPAWKERFGRYLV